MQRLSVDLVIDVQLEMFALPHVAHPAQAHPGQRAHDRLTLRIEDLRLGYDVDDHSRHGAEATWVRPLRGTLVGEVAGGPPGWASNAGGDIRADRAFQAIVRAGGDRDGPVAARSGDLLRRLRRAHRAGCDPGDSPAP